MRTSRTGCLFASHVSTLVKSPRSAKWWTRSAVRHSAPRCSCLRPRIWFSIRPARPPTGSSAAVPGSQAIARSGDRLASRSASETPCIAQIPSVLAKRIAPGIGRLEMVLKPRPGLIASSAFALRVVGAVALPLSVILLLPLPFLHMLPGAAMASLAVGLAERDGYTNIAGYILAFVTMATLILLGIILHSGFASS